MTGISWCIQVYLENLEIHTQMNRKVSIFLKNFFEYLSHTQYA